MASYKQKQYGVDKIAWNIPFKESKSVCGYFCGRVKGHKSQQRANANKPWCCPPICGILIAMRKNGKDLMAEEEERKRDECAECESGDGGL